MKQFNEIWFWFSLTVLPVMALFGFGYFIGRLVYSTDLKFENSGPLFIIPSCICAVFQFKRALSIAKIRFQQSSI